MSNTYNFSLHECNWYWAAPKFPKFIWTPWYNNFSIIIHHLTQHIIAWFLQLFPSKKLVTYRHIQNFQKLFQIHLCIDNGNCFLYPHTLTRQDTCPLQPRIRQCFRICNMYSKWTYSMAVFSFVNGRNFCNLNIRKKYLLMWTNNFFKSFFWLAFYITSGFLPLALWWLDQAIPWCAAASWRIWVVQGACRVRESAGVLGVWCGTRPLR